MPRIDHPNSGVTNQPVGENRYLIEDIPEPMRGFVIQDGFGYCLRYLNGRISGFNRVEIIPDSEMYRKAEIVEPAVADVWYTSHGAHDKFLFLVGLIEDGGHRA